MAAIILEYLQSAWRKMNWKIACGFLVLYVLCSQYLSMSSNMLDNLKESNWKSIGLIEKYWSNISLIDNNNKTNSEDSTSFPIQARFLTSHFASSARLGNHLFEMSSIFGIAKKLNRTPMFFILNKSYQKMIEYTKEIIPGLVDKYLVVNGTMVSGFKRMRFPKQCCAFDSPTRLENVTDTFLQLSGYYYQSWKYFPDDRKEIISFLTSKQDFEGLPKSNNENVITCIHVRRTDFVRQKRFTADKNFIIKASQLIDKKRKQEIQNREKIVVLFGDDQDYMKSIFSNETRHFISNNSPIDDLLYASQHCNNVFITAPVSTYGWWMGYLSGSNNVFYVDIKTVDDVLFKTGSFNPDDFFLPEWTPLKLDSDNVTVVESRA